MTGLFLGIFLLGVSIPAGSRLLQLFPGSFTRNEKFLFGSGLGLLLIAYTVLSLGLVGLLTPQWVTSGMIAIAFYGINASKNIFGKNRDRAPEGKSLALTVCLIFSGITLSAAFAGILAPETANDSLCYHLHIPKIFLNEHQIFKVPYEINSLFPFFMEMLDTVGIAWKQIPIAKLFHAFTALGAGGAVYALSKKVTSRTAAAFAALAFVTTPGIINQMGTTYVDISLAFFTALSLFAYIRLYQTRRLSWALLAGMMIGVGLSIKFLALIGFMAIAALIVFDGIFSKRKEASTALLLYGGAAFMICAYWYLRSWVEWGNPVYPYFYQVFKSGYIKDYSDIGVHKTVLDFLALPWTMTMKPQLFEGFGDNIGPFYLAFLPLAGTALFKKSLLKRISLFSFIYLFLWFLLGQSLRFFFPALPAIAVLCAAGLGRAEKYTNPLLKKGLFAVLLGIFFLHTLLAVYHYRHVFKVAAGFESRENYLRRTEREFKMAEYINANLPKNAKILNAVEVRMYYFNRTVVREDVYAEVTRYAEKSASAGEVLTRLKADGFTHFLLISEPHTDLSKMNPLRMPRLYTETEKSLAQERAPLYTYTFSDSDNPSITYQLYQL